MVKNTLLETLNYYKKVTVEPETTERSNKTLAHTGRRVVIKILIL